MRALHLGHFTALPPVYDGQTHVYLLTVGTTQDMPTQYNCRNERVKHLQQNKLSIRNGNLTLFEKLFPAT